MTTSVLPLNDQMDTHLFKYNPRGDSKDCFNNAEMSQSEIQGAATRLDGYKSSKILQDTFMFRKRVDFFKTYNNTAKAKDMAAKLKKTFNYPKMCASTSTNVTAGADYIEYYRGQNKKAYRITEKANVGSTIAQMDNGSTFLFDNGTSANNMIPNVS